MTTYEPIRIGPTWVKNDDDSWYLPEYTLGWQIAAWCTDYLLGEDEKPWRFTPEQLRWVLWWYAVDETGRFIHRKAVLQRLKGWGKDPLAAVLCLVELVGPSRFSHWDDYGNPVGTHHPQALVQIAAVNQAQTRNTTTLFVSLMSDHFIQTYNVDPGKEIIYARGGRVRLEAVTSSYRALEGGRVTFVILNETHHWVLGNNGHKMYETVDGNSTKKDSRYLAITNAYLPGEDSVAERMREAWEKINEGRWADIGFMYDSLEAPPEAPLTPEAAPDVLRAVRGDATWLRIETIVQSILDPTIAPSRSRRMWYNQVVAEEDSLYSAADYKAILAEGESLEPGDQVCLGFDGGKSDDATALVAIRVSDGLVQPLGIWEKPEGPAGEHWQVNRDAVDSEVHQAFASFEVIGFFADVALWESYIDGWSRDYGEGLAVKASTFSAVGWDMRTSLKSVTLEHEQLMGAILDQKVKVTDDPVLRRHMLNAKRRTNNYGLSFGKESRESPRKVDGYAAMLLAHAARRAYFGRGKKQRKRTAVGYFL